MAKRKSKSKAKKPRAGKSVGKAPKMGKAARRAGGKALLKAGARAVPGLGTAMAAGDAVSALRGSRTPKQIGFGKRRKGKIPKAVRKWASRIVSRRKQEEKLVRKLFGTGGGKVIKAQKKGSPGVITQEERLAALRR